MGLLGDKNEEEEHIVAPHSALDWVNIIAICVGCLACAMMVSSFVRRCHRTGALRRLFAAIAHRTKRWRRHLLKSKKADNEEHDGEDAELEAKIKAKLDQRRLAYGRGVLTVMAWVILARFPILVYEVFAEGRWPNSVMPLLVSIAICLTAVSVIWPSLVTVRTLAAWHIALMLLVGLVHAPHGMGEGSGQLALDNQRIFSISTLALGLVCLRFHVLFLTNFCMSLMVVWLQVVEAERRSHITSTPKDVISQEALGLILRLIFYWGFETMLKESVRAEVAIEYGQGWRAAVTSLMNMVCDAVVETDASLHVSMGGESIRHLLMIGAGKALGGTDFTSYLRRGPAELESFRDNIKRNLVGADGNPRPGMFGGSLADSCGKVVKVIFYHVPFSIGGSIHHLIGIRENIEDEDSKAQPLPSAAARRSAGSSQPIVPAVSDQDDVASMSSGSSAASSLNSGGSSVPGGLAIVVDVGVADRLPIRGATPRFWEKFFGGHPDLSQCFADLLAPVDAQALAPWISQRAVQAQSGTLSMPNRPFIESFGSVKLKGPPGKPGGWTHWQVKVCFPPASAGAESGEYRVSVNLKRRGNSASGAGTPAGMGTPAGTGAVANSISL